MSSDLVALVPGLVFAAALACAVWAAYRRNWVQTGLFLAIIVAIFGAYIIPVAGEVYGEVCHPWRRPVAAHISVEIAEPLAGVVEASGTTDLPDGAVVDYYFLNEAEMSDLTHLPRYQAGGEAEVEGGRFNLSQDLSRWPTGSVILGVEFAVGVDYPQPLNVVEIFGSQGECLTGPQVGVDSPGDPKTLYAEQRFNIVGRA